MHIAQSIAAQAVSEVLAGHNLTDELVQLMQQNAHVSGQQKAQAQHLSYGTLRHYLSLRHMLKQLLQKPMTDPLIEALLLVGLYQLHYDQASPHTVVNQAVIAVQYSKKNWAKALVNAVLRNFLRRQLELTDSLHQSLESTWNYPSWWIAQLQQEYPQQWQQILAVGNQHPPMTLRVNPRYSTGLAYQQKLSAADLASQLLDKQTLMLEQACAVDLLPGFKQGEVSVQDYAAQQTAALLDCQAGMYVLDACAAPGGKTCQLLENVDVELLALDISAQRLARVESNLARLQLSAKTMQADAARPEEWWNGRQFDRILIDAPCSASGVVRRHVDIKWLRRQSDISSFAAQQKTMLDQLWPLLIRGGKLLYVTCSVFAAENSLQINNFLQTHDDALNLSLGQLAKTIQISHGQLIPNSYHDGLYFALLQKR